MQIQNLKLNPEEKCKTKLERFRKTMANRQVKGSTEEKRESNINKKQGRKVIQEAQSKTLRVTEFITVGEVATR